MPSELHTLSTEERAGLQSWSRITIDGHPDQLGTIVTYRYAETGEITEINAYSFAANTWLNLLTGRPIGDPRDTDDLDTMARHYDARGLAADLESARRLAETQRRRDPTSYKTAVDEIRSSADTAS
jgi:hypothetical protein